MATTSADIEAAIRAARGIIDAAGAESAGPLVSSITAQVERMTTLDHATATALTVQVSESAFTAEQKATLSHSLLSQALRLNAGGYHWAGRPGAHANDLGGVGPAPRVSGSIQTLDYPTEVHTAKDYAGLEAPGLTTAAAVVIGGSRFERLGLRHPGEAAIKGECALLACFLWLDSWPSAAESHDLVRLFKSQLHANREHGFDRPPIVSLATYHPDPQVWPVALRNQAYDPDDPPVSRIIPRMGLMRCKMVMRSHIITVAYDTHI